MEEEKLIIDVETEEERRMDQFLADQMEYSRSFIQKLIKNERVTVNGNVITKVKYPVSFRDKIIIEIPAPTELEIKPEKMDLDILYEDNDIIVVIKPAGLESQSGKSFAPDMVSEIRKHLASHPQDIHKLTKETSTASKYPQPPYVGVIHRLDRPVSGIMVYAKNPKAAASLSTSLQQGKIEKWYQAVICGKPVDNNGTYVDYLKQDKKNNCSRIVDKSDPDGKRAELEYKVLDCMQTEEKDPQYLSLVEIKLLTGRHHQIRVQFSGHGTPLYGDGNTEIMKKL